MNTRSTRSLSKLVRLAAAWLSVAGTGALSPACSAPAADSSVGPEAVAFTDQAIKGCHTGFAMCGFDDQFNAICCPPGTTCGDQGCETAPPPKPAPLEVYPKYYVLSVIYSPPGAMSSVSYGAGSTAGTKVEAKGVTSGTLSLEFEVTGVELDAEAKIGNINGSSAEIKKTTTYTYTQTASSSRGTDELVSGDDVFKLWLNPKIDVSVLDANHAGLALSYNGDAAVIVDVSAAELRDPTLMLPDRQALFASAGLDSADFATILGLDPVAHGDPLDPKRFTPAAIVQLDGPSRPGADLPSHMYSVSYENTAGTSTGNISTYTVGVKFGGGVDFFGLKANLKLGLGWEWENESTRETAAGTVQNAGATLGAVTPGYRALYDVLYDNIYQTFAFRKHAVMVNPHVVAGVVVDSNSAPVVNQTVSVTSMTDGSVRQVRTADDGSYVVLDPPAGPVLLQAADASATVAVTMTDDVAAPTLQVGGGVTCDATTLACNGACCAAPSDPNATVTCDPSAGCGYSCAAGFGPSGAGASLVCTPPGF